MVQEQQSVMMGLHRPTEMQSSSICRGTLRGSPLPPRQMRLRFIPPELEAFTRSNPARGSADIHNDELNIPRSEQAADVIFGERSDPCRGVESIISPQFAERQVRHDLERGVHVASTDLIVVQELDCEWPAFRRHIYWVSHTTGENCMTCPSLGWRATFLIFHSNFR